MELLLRLFKHKRYNHDNVVIFSDCQGVLKALKTNKLSVYHNPYILEARNLECWKLITLFNINIFFIWIPSHWGFIGNEIVDLLAKHGALERAEKHIRVPFQDLISIFKNEEWNETQERLLASKV